MAASNAFRNQWLSLKPAITIGTSAAPGSASASQALIVTGQRRVGGRAVADHVLDELQLVSSMAPSTAPARSRTSASPIPGGTRQSTRISARRGDHVRLLGAPARVGVNVTRSIGSTR